MVAPFNDPDVRARCSSAVLCRVIDGFAFLHSQGIAHGGRASTVTSLSYYWLDGADPHIGNIGIALPQLQGCDEEDINEYFANPEIFPVIPRDPSFRLESIPPYLVKTSSIVGYLLSENLFPSGSSMTVRILDFGRCEHHTLSQLPVSRSMLT